MDWNIPSFTACLVSALVLSLAMLICNYIEQYPFRDFHRFPYPCYGNSTLSAQLVLSAEDLFASERCCSLVNQATLMGLTAQSCLGAESPQSSCDPNTTTTYCMVYEAPELWHLIHEVKFTLGLGSRPPWVSSWDLYHLCHFPLCSTVFR